jgi:hypothetical protein
MGSTCKEKEPMISHRTNREPSRLPADLHSTTSDSFAAMQRLSDQAKAARTQAFQPPHFPKPPLPPSGGDEGGDVVYGARAIAVFLFGDGSNKARRQVFNLWTHYRDRKEQAGFFKLKGALCLCKSLWRKFHGLD